MRSVRLNSLVDALHVMHKSRILSCLLKELRAHRSNHQGEFFYPCQMEPCSRIPMHVRLYVEAAQEELDTAQKLARAIERTKKAFPVASDQAIESLAESAIKASSHPDYSNNPLNWLESPYDPVRIYNRKYPALEFHRGPHRNANPAFSVAYYLRFRESGSEDLLFEFMDAHPVEFQCSGWVSSVLGEKLLGLPCPGSSEKQAQDLFRRYWKRVKHSKTDMPSQPQMFVLAIASQEEAEIAGGKHREHFERAVRRVARPSDSRAASVAFMRDIGNGCSCFSLIDFSELNNAVQYTQRVEDANLPPIAHVLQDYVGRVCGIPSRTLRSWRQRFKLSAA